MMMMMMVKMIILIHVLYFIVASRIIHKLSYLLILRRAYANYFKRHNKITTSTVQYQSCIYL